MANIPYVPWDSSGAANGAVDPNIASGYYTQTNLNAQAQAKSGDRIPWKMPLPNGGPNWTPSQAWWNSWNSQETNPVSGYSSQANYGAPLGRFQFSNTAPVPATAPVGWGRYPGTAGGQPTAPWVQNPYMPPLPGQTPNPSTVHFNQFPTLPPRQPITPTIDDGGGPGGGGGGGGGGYVPITGNQLPPLVDQFGNRAGPPPQTTTTNAADFLKSFKFNDAPAGSEAAKVNAMLAKYGINDAMNYLSSNAWNTLGNQFTSQATQAGLSNDDLSRIINNWGAGGGSYLPELGGYNGGHYSWGLGAKRALPPLQY